ncbi:MAG: hypothetical protein R3246_15755, partial [Acidimicrobiia bacterium]|nr:hypothetical protein [Acidimicrobiia bacterium]
MNRRIGAFAVAFATVTIGGAAVAAVGGAPTPSHAPGAALDFAAERAESADPAPVAASVALAPADPDPRAGRATRAPSPTMTSRVPDRLSDVAPDPADDTPPRITIIEPDQGAEFRHPHIVVAGVTEPGAKVVLGDRVARIDDEGHWKIEVELEPGENRLVFLAIDPAGNVGKAELTVYFRPAVDHRFTANQRYEIVDEDPAVNYYWGTAQPGAEIKIRSEYGHGATQANRDGKWETRVEFTAMPCNEYFRVVAHTGDKLIDFKMKKACPTDHRFTANQRYEIVDEDPAVNYYWGTAQPGAEIKIRSE